MESRTKPGIALRQLLLISDKLEWVINERALAYGDGEHPKHRLTNYHEFFIQNIHNGQRILDVGCGYGSVSRSIAIAHPDSVVIGLDIDKARLSQAQNACNPPNLSFLEGDATKYSPEGSWDVVVLSNVLEHISNRVDFLQNLQKVTNAKTFLIRVPLFERSWQMPLRDELGVSYYSDDDHKIEHRVDEFVYEVTNSGLKITEMITIWGEIWSCCDVNIDGKRF